MRSRTVVVGFVLIVALALVTGSVLLIGYVAAAASLLTVLTLLVKRASAVIRPRQSSRSFLAGSTRKIGRQRDDRPDRQGGSGCGCQSTGATDEDVGRNALTAREAARTAADAERRSSPRRLVPCERSAVVDELISRVASTPERQPSNERLVRRIRAEFLEMPGLCLTIEQAQRLWSLEPRTCEALLNPLIDSRFLRRTDRGLFVLRRPAAGDRMRGISFRRN